MKKLLALFFIPLLFSCGESKEELREQIEERDETISSLNNQIEELQNRINDLQCTIEEMEERRPAYNYRNQDQVPASPNVVQPSRLPNNYNTTERPKESLEEALERLNKGKVSSQP